VSLIGVHIEAIVECPKCSAGVPINGAAQSLLCSQCQHTIEMSLERWVNIFSDLIGEAATYKEGAGSNATIMSGLTYKVTYGRVAPRCQACKHDLSDDVLEAAADAGSLSCPSCGDPVRVRRPPEWMNRVHPLATLLVGESLAADAVAPDPDDPIQIHCISCGAGLEVDGSSRNVPCTYCKEATYIPDKLWLRLHPAVQREPWQVCLDLGDAVGLLPEEVDNFFDLAPGPDDTTLLVYHHDPDDSGEEYRMVAVDRRGGIRWERRDVKFGNDTRFAVAAGGEVLVLVDSQGVDYGDGGPPCFTFLDPKTGTPRVTVECQEPEGDSLAPSKLRPPNLRQARGFCADVDGTFLILQYGNRERRPTLTRYGSDGEPVPLWPDQPSAKPEEAARRPGFFARLFGSGGKATSDGLSAEVEYAQWGELQDRLAVPPDDVVMGMGLDGRLYLADENGGHLAAYRRSGRLEYERVLEGLQVHEVHAVTADADGTVYLLFETTENWRGDTWSHVARVRAGEPPELWLGVLVPQTPSLIGEYDEHLCIGRDGALYVGDDVDSLRVIAPDGTTLWRSLATARNDADAEGHLRGEKEG